MLATVMCSAFASAATLDTNYASIKAAKGTPTIDGEIDAIWNNTEVQYITALVNNSEGTTAPNARFRVMWDDSWLYFLYEVADMTMGDLEWESKSAGGNLYKRDSISVAFDPLYGRNTTTTQVKPSHWFIMGVFGSHANFNNIAGTNGFVPEKVFYETVTETVEGQEVSKIVPYWSSKIVKNTEGDSIGYVLEAKIDFKVIEDVNYTKFEAGQLIGFDTYINDNNAITKSAGRDNNLSWTGGTNSYKNDAEKGTIVLEGPTYKADNSTLDSFDKFFDVTAVVTTAAPVEIVTMPVETKAATTAAATTAAATAAATTAATEEGGCGSAIGVTAACAISSVCLAGVVIGRKKED